MQRRFMLLFVPLLTAACGSGSKSTPASVSGIFPDSAFLARSTRIEISGSATRWSAASAPAVSVGGSGVTVDGVQVASPTTLFAQVTVDPAAMPGVRSVHVGNLVLSSALELVSPISVQTTGTLAQGSVADLTIVNLDPSTPFDDTHSVLGIYPNLSFDVPPGVTVGILDASSDVIHVQALIDVDATAAPLVVHDGAVLDPIGGDLAVAARSPIALTDSVAASGSVATPLASTLYELASPAVPSLMSFAVTTTNAIAAPTVVILPASGHFADFAGFAQGYNGAASNGASTFYALVVDFTQASGYDFAITGSSGTFTTASEAAGNDAYTTAQPIPAMPFLMQNATLSSSSDMDWLKLTAAAADVGKSIHVQTSGDPLTDTVVQLFESDGTTAFSDPSDFGYQENLTSAPIPSAGTYFVEISASTFGFSIDHESYEAAVWLR